MFSRKKIVYTILLVLILIFTWVIGYTLHVTSVHAQEGLFAGMRECKEKGNCTLDDFLRLGVNAANIMMKVVGVAALVMFIVGGIHWLTAGGRENQIKKGKAIIAGAVTGLFLVFFSWFIVRAIQDIIQIREEYKIIGWAPENCQVTINGEKMTAPDGTPCSESPNKDENQVCKGGRCVSKCEAYYGDKGYECTVVAECNPNWDEEKFDECISDKGCMRDLCPGVKNDVCCKE